MIDPDEINEEFCKTAGFDYFPKSIHPNGYCRIIEKLIEHQARKLLPATQFTQTISPEFEFSPSPKQRKHFTEMSGIWCITHRRRTVEASFVPPERSVAITGSNKIIRVESRMHPEDINYDLIDGHVFYYHTHPFGSGNAFTCDAIGLNVLIIMLQEKGIWPRVKRVSAPIYVPLENKTYWYIARRIQNEPMPI